MELHGHGAAWASSSWSSSWSHPGWGLPSGLLPESWRLAEAIRARSTAGAAVVTGDAVKAAAETIPAGRAFLWRRLDLVRVKGREEPLLLHEPLCRQDEATPALREEVARHETALDAYLARDFAAARALWRALREAHPCELYALWTQRASLAEAHPPPPEWDGVWSHTTK